MYLFDNKISLDTRDGLQPYLDGYEYKTSGLAFTSLYMWRDVNDFCWDIFGDYACICGISHLELEDGIILPFMSPPLTKDGEYNKDSIRESIFLAKEHFEKQGQPFSIRLVPPSLVKLISEAVPEMEWIDDRPNYDYIYDVDQLVELKGRKFHGKKNHLNYFKANNEYEYVPMTSAMTDELMDYVRAFNARKDIPANEMELLKFEENAMEDVFSNLEATGMEGGVIKINGKIEAIAAGGRLGSDMIVEHIEKANVDFRGLYPAINNEFSKSVQGWAKYMNREEDMDIMNLRKAKLSYRPVEILEKYIGVFK